MADKLMNHLRWAERLAEHRLLYDEREILKKLADAQTAIANIDCEGVDTLLNKSKIHSQCFFLPRGEKGSLVQFNNIDRMIR
mmetsp:Transcript_34044/g.44931  ORF Transcript_34044/g.44931 Transcript_34044/m.44931 type:complete len:82 (+) Transcript_34044:48-293(+)